MKKILVSVLSLLFIFCCVAGSTLAYSTSDYSIDIPSKFTYWRSGDTTTNWAYENNAQLAIAVVDNEDDDGSGDIVKDIYDGKKDVDNLIDRFVKDNAGFNKNDVFVKEVTTISKNKYKAIHFGAKVKTSDVIGCMEFYIVLAGNHDYMITYVYLDGNDPLTSSEREDMLDSFVIKNDKVYTGSKSKSDDEKESNNKLIIVSVIVGATILIVLILGIVVIAIIKRK